MVLTTYQPRAKSESENLRLRPCRIDRAVEQYGNVENLDFLVNIERSRLPSCFFIWLFALFLHRYEAMQSFRGQYVRIMPSNHPIRARVIAATNTSLIIIYYSNSVKLSFKIENLRKGSVGTCGLDSYH